LGAHRLDQSILRPKFPGLLRAPAADLEVAGEGLRVGRRESAQQQFQ
jgi:hypothetical protein